MNGILSGLHPTFDALSAHADRGDVDGTRTRVGRHVARCTRCREVVAEIRGMGDAARAMNIAGAPAGLWVRIQAAAREPGAPEPGLRPMPAVPEPRRARRALVGLTLAAAALVAIVTWPRPSGLQAAGTSRLTFSPTRPVAGGTVTVRYQPSARMKDAPRLILVGRFARTAGANPVRFSGSVFDALGDSLGVLARAPDGAFVTTIELPSDFLAVGLGVLDPARDEYDVDGLIPWLIVGGTPARAPSLASLLAAHEIRPEWYGGDGRARPRQAVDVADSLKRHFPRHPAGWAFSRAYGVSKGRFDLLRFFQSAERKYASMSEELWPAKALDAERLHDMVVFARNIDEPGEALRWSARLVEEHPEDPRALADLTGALHQIELRMPTALGDSIRPWLSVLDRAYRAGPVPNQGFDEALRLAVAYGDSAAKALWVGRSGANDGTGNIWRLMRSAQHPARDGVVEELRARADRGCALPAGRLPLSQTIAGWRILCERHRGMAYGYLAAQTLNAGRARAALADADSAIAASRRGQLCVPFGGHFAHAYASLALGDTATAETDFVLGLAGYPSSMTRMVDTVRSRLGPRFVEERYLARRDTASRAAQACVAAQRARAAARGNRLDP